MDLEKKDFLKKGIEDNLYEYFAKSIDDARDSEFYYALAKTIKSIIGKNWNKSKKDNKGEKTLYVLSFEYSLGSRLVSNAIRLDIFTELKEIIEEAGRDFEKIYDREYEHSLGFGDLGLLSSSILDSLTNMDKKVFAYGLRYRKGMLKQLIIDGRQVEERGEWLDYKNPWEHDKSFSHTVDMKDITLKAIPYDLPIVGNKNGLVNTLRLWKSVSKNDVDYRLFSEGKIQESYRDINRANSIVEFIYPQEDSLEGRKLRLSQEYFFAYASMRDILKRHEKYYGYDIWSFSRNAIIQINDVHPILSELVFIKLLQDLYGLKSDDAIEIARDSFVYFNTTLLSEAFEKWDLNLIASCCPDIVETIELVDKRLKTELKKSDLNIEEKESLHIIKDGYVDMVNVAFHLSKKIILSSRQHAKIIKEVYLPVHYNYYLNKLDIVSTGIDSFNYLEETDSYLYEKLKSRQDDFRKGIEPSLELLDFLYESKARKKKELLDFLGNDYNFVNPNSIFDMNLGVIHEYKRQLLNALSIAFLYFDLKRKPNLDIPERTYFIGGKSYPNYYFAKEIIKFIHALSILINRDYTIRDKIKIVFIEDYDVNKSKKLIPAADIYENLSVISMGKVSTEVFKYMINGAIPISSDLGIAQTYNEEMSGQGFYIFGPTEREAIEENLHRTYKVYDYINNNPIIWEFFDFYKSLPYHIFPYDFNIIIDNLLKYNDGYYVIRDLLSHYEVRERAMKDYMDKRTWSRSMVNNISFSLDHKLNDEMESQMRNFWSKDDE